MFAGPNGSGKSTLYWQLVEKGLFHNTIFINADEIERTLNQGSEVRLDFIKPERFLFHISQSGFIGEKILPSAISSLSVKAGLAISLKPGFVCAEHLSAAIAEALRLCLIEGAQSFAFETVMSHSSKIDLLRDAKQLGYRTYLYFVTTGDPSLNVDRVCQRVANGGHGVSEEKTLSRYPKTMKLLPQALQLCDRAYLFDSSSDSIRLVASISEGRNVRLESDSIPEWLLETMRSMGLDIEKE